MYKTSAQIVKQSGTGFIIVTNAEHLNALCGGAAPTADAPLTVIASTFVSPVVIVPTGMGAASVSRSCIRQRVFQPRTVLGNWRIHLKPLS